MDEAQIVALKIIAMFLVMAVGYFARRREILDAQTTPVLSRFVTDFTLPALILTQMVDTVDLASLRVGWTIPLIASAGSCLGFLLGLATWRMFARKSQAPVFIFASGISNWMYLPLPIVTSLYKAEGLQTLFLCNAGVQILFWTLGVAIMHGGRLDQKSLKHLATNPGLIATFLGISLAVFRGSQPQMTGTILGQPAVGAVISLISDGLRLLAQATIGLSLVVTGAQIATATMVQKRPTSALAGIVLNRLILAPLLCLGMIYLAAMMFPALSVTQLLVMALVLLMPVSVTSTVLTDKMNQDTALAAQAVLYSTLASIATVPLMFLLAKHMLVR